MANKPLKSIKFPGLSDTYTVPEIDNTLSVTGKAADAKKVGDELALKANSTAVTTQIENAIAENIDNRLVTSGKAADAKKVGDELASKANTSSLPTKVSELTNDSNFQTKTQVDAALANKIDNTLSVTGKAADAGKTGEAIADLKEDLTELEKTDVKQKLLNDNIPDTTQSYTFAGGSVSKVEHKSGNTVIRTDAFTYTDSVITETRTLNTGDKLVIATNLSTLETTVTYTAA